MTLSFFSTIWKKKMRSCEDENVGIRYFVVRETRRGRVPLFPYFLITLSPYFPPDNSTPSHTPPFQIQ